MSAFFGQSSVSIVTDWINFEAYNAIYTWSYDGDVIQADITSLFPISNAEISTLAHHWVENPFYFEDLRNQKKRGGKSWVMRVEKQYNAIGLWCDEQRVVDVAVPERFYKVLGNKLYRKYKMCDTSGPCYTIDPPQTIRLPYFCSYAFSLIYG